MLKLRDYDIDYLYSHPKKNINRVELIAPDKLTKDKKIPIVSNTMFKTMFFNEKRIKYSSKLLSYLVDVSFEDLCKSLTLVKDELDKSNYYDKK